MNVNKFFRRALGLAAMAGALFMGSAQAATVTVEGYRNPWTAGLPDGYFLGGGDSTPGQSAKLVAGLSFKAGDTLTFSASGSVNYGGASDGPDGGGQLLTFQYQNWEHGVSNINAPLNGLVGIFLSDDFAAIGATPYDLDFSASGNVAGGVNYETLSPLLKQVFFIGDGLTDSGLRQQIIAPEGATRLFLGTMDGSGWYNNSGEFTVEVANASAVPEPNSAALLGVAGLAFAGCRRRTKKRGVNPSAA